MGQVRPVGVASAFRKLGTVSELDFQKRFASLLAQVLVHILLPEGIVDLWAVKLTFFPRPEETCEEAGRVYGRWKKTFSGALGIDEN